MRYNSRVKPTKGETMKKHALPLLLFLLGSLLLVGRGSTPPASGNTSTPAPAVVTLHVFAASSLTDSFNTMATKYHQLHPNVTIQPVYNGSQALEQQIANGAPADIFASADTTNIQKASQAGLVGTSQVFARNRLVVIIPVGNPGHISTLKDLARSRVKIDLAAPTVTVGKYALQWVANLANSPDYRSAYQDAVLKNVVSQEENVKAVVQKIQLGEADAGIVYVTDVTASASSQVSSLAIPDNFNVNAGYPIPVVKSTTHST